MLFDTTIRREVARGFGATLVVLLTIVVTMFLIRLLGLAANGAADPADVVLLLTYTVLGHLPTMMALSLFIAVVVSLGRMYRDSEMSIWFASGVGLARFVRPVLRAAWPVLALVAILSLVMWPWANGQISEMRQRYEGRSDLSRVSPGSFQASRDGSRVFFIEKAGEQAGIGRNVFVLSREEDREAVTTARSGRIESTKAGRELMLEEGHRHETLLKTGEHLHTHFEQYRMAVDPSQAAAAQTSTPKSMSTLELIASGAPAQRGELVWRLGLLFGAANLTVMGIGMSATNPRRASNWNLLFALLSFVVYYNLVNLSQAWVASGRVGALLTCLLLHGGAFAVSVTLIWWRDHANVATWRRPRAGTGAPA